MENYHTVFVPCPDIFELSGKEVFTKLERTHGDGKNLVIVSMGLVDELHQIAGDSASEGAADALQFLKEQRRNSGPPSKEGISFGTISGGLDIAFVQKDSKRSRGGFLVPDLEKVVTANINRKPVFITSSARNHIDYLGRGMLVEEPRFLQVNADIVREGIVSGSDDLLARLNDISSGHTLPLEEAAAMLGQELRLNQFVRFTGPGQYQYARVAARLVKSGNGTIVEVRDPQLKLLDPRENSKRMHIGEHSMDNILGIKPRDMEQYIAFQYGLLNPDVQLFFLCGSQGSGKTLLTYVAAVDQVLFYGTETSRRRGMDESRKSGGFRHIILLKPNEVLGGSRREVGALPGSLYEKMRPHLEPYIDAHEESVLGELFPFEQMLYHPRFSQNGFPQRSEEANKANIPGGAHLPFWEVMRMTYSGFMRGRSFRDTLVIVDEAQNFTPYEVKTILERIAEGSKIIIMGDSLQTDNPHCSRGINGLTHAIKQYLDRPYTALVNLSTNYRSQVSDDAQGWRTFSS